MEEKNVFPTPVSVPVIKKPFLLIILNSIFKQESENKFKNLIGYTSDPIVSSDVIGREETMVFDAKATMLTADKLLKTLCWYDNGWGFSKRILDTISLYKPGDDN